MVLFCFVGFFLFLFLSFLGGGLVFGGFFGGGGEEGQEVSKVT